MRNVLLLSVITSTIACQDQSSEMTTSEAPQQRQELQPNFTKMTDSFQRYVDGQMNDFAFTQNKLAERQPNGPECLFGGEIQGQIDMSEPVVAWHIELLDDQATKLDTIEHFSHTSGDVFPAEDWQLHADNLSFSFDPLVDVELNYAPVTTDNSSKEITLQPERVSVEIDVSRTEGNAQLSGEWYICVEYAQ